MDHGIRTIDGCAQIVHITQVGGNQLHAGPHEMRGAGRVTNERDDVVPTVGQSIDDHPTDKPGTSGYHDAPGIQPESSLPMTSRELTPAFGED